MQELPEESAERFARVEKLLRTQRTLPAKLESVAAMATRTVPNSRTFDGSIQLVEYRPRVLDHPPLGITTG